MLFDPDVFQLYIAAAILLHNGTFSLKSQDEIRWKPSNGKRLIKIGRYFEIAVGRMRLYLDKEYTVAVDVTRRNDVSLAERLWLLQFDMKASGGSGIEVITTTSRQHHLIDSNADSPWQPRPPKRTSNNERGCRVRLQNQFQVDNISVPYPRQTCAYRKYVCSDRERSIRNTASEH